MLETNTECPSKATVWLHMQPAVHHASGECIPSKGKEERMGMLLKNAQECQQTFLVCHRIASLSNHHEIFCLIHV